MAGNWRMAREQKNIGTVKPISNLPNILTVIPARGGSKGVPNKNIKKLGDKPLIGYTIEAALNSKYLHKPIISTDNEDIAKISKDYGASIPFIRPKKYATDNA